MRTRWRTRALPRTDAGGCIDRDRPLAFTFDGSRYQGFAGDTLASALLANGVRQVGRSARWRRRRGIVTASAAEPNAWVRLAGSTQAGAGQQATQVPLHDGLVAHSLAAPSSIGSDARTLADRLCRALPPALAGAAARLLRRVYREDDAPTDALADRGLHRHAHCDVLVCGGGPAGLAAALAAARGGARVVLADDDIEPGGFLLGDTALINRNDARRWVQEVLAELRSTPGARVLVRSRVVALWDDGVAGIVEQVGGEAPPAHVPRQRLWKVHARETILATGAVERIIAFGDNDLPGVMLAGAARTYLNRQGVVAGRRAVVFTTGDSAWHAALDLHRAGVEVVAIVDARAQPAGDTVEAAVAAGIEVHRGHGVLRALGRTGIRGALVAPVDARGQAASDVRGHAFALRCDLLLVSGGWRPAVDLWVQAGGRLRPDDASGASVPDPTAGTPPRLRCIGAAAGSFALADCVVQGFAAGRAAASDAGLGRSPTTFPPLIEREAGCPPAPIEAIDYPGAHRWKRFVDLRADLTIEDLERADGPATGAPPTPPPFRPPSSALALGTLAGPGPWPTLDPVRRTAIDDWHVANGAVCTMDGAWHRPRFYPRPGEADADAVAREVHAVRRAAALADVGMHGRIDVQGRDAGAFLQRVLGRDDIATLAVGHCLRSTLIVEAFRSPDDAIVARLGERQYLLAATTSGAGPVLARLRSLLHAEMPTPEVFLTAMTDAQTAIVLAGPRAGAVLHAATGGDLSATALPPMAWRNCTIAGMPARVFRTDVLGGDCCEVHLRAGYGRAAWEALLAAGRPLGLVPIGIEAIEVLRIEEGRSPPDIVASDRASRVGLIPVATHDTIPRGAMLVNDARPLPRCEVEGAVLSTGISPTIGCSIALARLAGGASRRGERLWALSPLTDEGVRVEVVAPVFVDRTPSIGGWQDVRAAAVEASAPGKAERIDAASRWPESTIDSPFTAVLAAHATAQGDAVVGGDGRNAGVVLAPVNGRALMALCWPPGASFAPIVHALGLRLPQVAPAGTSTSDGTLHVLCSEPGEVLISLDAARQPAIQAALRDAVLATGGTLLDIGDGVAILNLSGPAAADVLAQCCALDLDGAMFPPGASTRTIVSRIPVLLHRLPRSAGYELHVDRNLAQALWEAMAAAAAEPGYRVASPGPAAPAVMA
jgi:sarcosine oxidase subunit alpha